MERARRPHDRVRQAVVLRQHSRLLLDDPAQALGVIDGHPVVVLYAAGFAKAHDQGCIDYVKAEFPRQFGGAVPYIIREASWRVKTDNVYAWGGAIQSQLPWRG